MTHVRSERPDAGPPRILVAEDELFEAMEVEDAVRRSGCEPVGPVPSVAETLRLVHEEPLDAAVLDVDLRGGLVFEAADELHQRGLPILFVTGYDEARLPERFRSTLRLRKPYLPRQLEAKLRQLLQHLKERARTSGRRTVEQPG